MQKVLYEVLAAIKPSPEELEEEIAFATLLVDHVRANVPAGCEVLLAGSTAKRTFLRDKRDIDIFILFDRSVPKAGLEPAVRAVMDSAFPTLGYQLSYAEHPYVRFRFEGRRIDLVPAYRITDASERLSAVDRSALHTRFVLDSLREGQAGEVLLLKQFLQANGLYGAEIKVEGFSGYLCELLIIRYGTFAKLVTAAAKWKGPVFIDIPAAYPGTKERKEAAKRFGFFTVIDPTDRNRNVAAAVSRQNLSRFVSLCKAFLKKPSSGFFLKKPETFDEKLAMAARGKKAFVLSMPRPEVVDDVLWGQLRKMSGQLAAHLKDFRPEGMISDDSRHIVRLGIVLERDTLPRTMLLAGPPLKMVKHAAEFRKRHVKAKFTIRGRRIYAEVKRPVVKAEEAIRGFFHAFAGAKSHLAYPDEMLVLERFSAGAFPRLRMPGGHGAEKKKSAAQGQKKPEKAAKRLTRRVRPRKLVKGRKRK